MNKNNLFLSNSQNLGLAVNYSIFIKFDVVKMVDGTKQNSHHDLYTLWLLPNSSLSPYFRQFKIERKSDVIYTHIYWRVEVYFLETRSKLFVHYTFYISEFKSFNFIQIIASFLCWHAILWLHTEYTRWLGMNYILILLQIQNMSW